MNGTEVEHSSTRINTVWLAFQVGYWNCLTILIVTGNVVVLMAITLGAKRLCSSMYIFYASLATSDCLIGEFIETLKLLLLQLEKRHMKSILCIISMLIFKASR